LLLVLVSDANGVLLFSRPDQQAALSSGWFGLLLHLTGEQGQFTALPLTWFVNTTCCSTACTLALSRSITYSVDSKIPMHHTQAAQIAAGGIPPAWQA
jgi:hypothetical protein